MKFSCPTTCQGGVLELNPKDALEVLLSHLDGDLFPMAQICKEEGEILWTRDLGFQWVVGLVWPKVGRSPDLFLQEGKLKVNC